MKLSRQFTRREKILLVILALLILVALYFYAVHYPAVQIGNSSKSEIDSLNTEIRILQAKKDKMDRMNGELDDLLARPDTVAIPDYDNLQQVISFLNNVLFSTGDYDLSFPGIDFPTDDGHIARRYLQMSFVSPSYSAARKMIDQLQTSPYCCQINEMRMECVSSDGKSLKTEDAVLTESNVKVTLSMTFFENTQ